MLDILRENWIFFLIGQYPHGPLGGLALTVILAFVCLLLAIPGGLILGGGEGQYHQMDTLSGQRICFCDSRYAVADGTDPPHTQDQPPPESPAAGKQKQG